MAGPTEDEIAAAEALLAARDAANVEKARADLVALVTSPELQHVMSEADRIGNLLVTDFDLSMHFNALRQGISGIRQSVPVLPAAPPAPVG